MGRCEASVDDESIPCNPACRQKHLRIKELSQPIRKGLKKCAFFKPFLFLKAVATHSRKEHYAEKCEKKQFTGTEVPFFVILWYDIGVGLLFGKSVTLLA